MGEVLVQMMTCGSNTMGTSILGRSFLKYVTFARMGLVHRLSDSKVMQLKLKLGCFNRVVRKYIILVDENVHKPSVMMT